MGGKTGSGAFRSYGSLTEQIERTKAQLKEKLVAWKEKKGMLDQLKAENGVLQRTEEILRSRDSNLREFLEMEEKKKGIKGHRAMVDAYADVSRLKQQTDEDKQRVLEEHTKLVSEIQATMTTKKETLTPLMTQLRAARLQASELQQERNAKKSTYDALTLQLQGEEANLRGEVKQLREEEEELQGDYLKAQMRIHLMGVTTQKVKGSIKPEGYATFKEMYEKRDPELRQAQNSLREAKRDSTV